MKTLIDAILHKLRGVRFVVAFTAFSLLCVWCMATLGHWESSQIDYYQEMPKADYYYVPIRIRYNTGEEYVVQRVSGTFTMGLNIYYFESGERYHDPWNTVWNDFWQYHDKVQSEERREKWHENTEEEQP